MKLHHIHAAPAKSDISMDIGSVRIRLDGGDWKTKKSVIHRLAFLWNMHDGIPMDVLESGAIRKFNDTVQEMIDAFPKTKEAKKVSKAWDAIRIEYTKDGRRAHCDCAEKKPSKRRR